MPMPWLRAEPFFFGVGGIADQLLLGVTLPSFRGDDAPAVAVRYAPPAVEPYQAFGFDDAAYLRSRLHDRRR